MRRIGIAGVLFLATFSPARAAYDVNGVALGATEQQVKKAFPTAFCKPLEWTSAAADRRCDDAKVTVAGVQGRITFYLKQDAVQAFDLRFDTRDLDRLVVLLKKQYGKPHAEGREPTQRDGKTEKSTYKALWQSGPDRATLVSQTDKRRSQLTVFRGNWEEEIYKVR